MSQTEPQQMGSIDVGTGQRGPIFRAYTEQRRPRFQLRYLLYPAALLLIGGLGVWTVSYRQEAVPFRLDTYRGLRTVHRGMSPQDVKGILGQPIAREMRGNLECFQYGRPSLKVPYYTLHTLCYEGGKLREVSARRYNSWVVTSDGAISPAPLEEEEAPAAPASNSSPGLATTPQP
ncbi:hypothetical protein JRI60_39865 [Archangium violaceum]|uniref:hypothetical protein n=1 Tax=Archangium violaceum TaxID=83451 RepID=UPI0019506AC8|nr:hypothetical protein [Archangium violaceum]QRN95181.1 hypothetical protein JRI60_39865 [Archangium violaceum]